MDENEIIIPIDELVPEFEEHLKIKNNSRILFSGKFGIGKTYFLNEFFKSKDDKYDVYHLYPVNYQIASNEAIFDFIKCDLLVELLNSAKKGKKQLFKENEFHGIADLQRLLYFWGKGKYKDIIKDNITTILPKLGKSIKEIIDLTEDFHKFVKEMEKGDGGRVEEFIEKIKKEDCTETDLLSTILKEKILEKKGDDRESVLILDDLDRMDPEHIFRILNVFSAHFDQNHNNKFGFDKIILVADYNNLESIFHHKYGKSTDSSGYFDKFFCGEIFHFDNRELIQKYIAEITSRLKRSPHYTGLYNEDNGLVVFLRIVMYKLADLEGKERLSIRQTLTGTKYPISVLNNGNFRYAEESEEKLVQYVRIGTQTLVALYGTKENLLSALEKCKQLGRIESTFDREIKAVSEALLPMMKSYDKTKSNVAFTWNGYNIEIHEGNINMDTTKLHKLFFDLLIEYTRDSQ